MKEKKKILLPALAFLSIISIGMLELFFCYIAYPGFSALNAYLPLLAFLLCGALFLALCFVFVNMLIALSPWANFIISARSVYRGIDILWSFILLWAKLFGIKRRALERSFVTLNNNLLDKSKIRVLPQELLVISPHCLQLASCKNKITYDINNCQRCGACSIGALLDMARRLGFNFRVVTGGTLARKVVKETRPRLVLAIACERDLASGIHDIYPLPAVGVLNIRPNGPCYNTTVDLKEIEAALKKYLKNEE